jgi:hypothetical protein
VKTGKWAMWRLVDEEDILGQLAGLIDHGP